ncbi:transcriptional regulator, BadM/Rrf2 family [Emticicia oligotrophica DSM 17448]|uniref:Transcriptional regulator, BadM/Rrf2 family n=1 Tax=Emticicia oligotrophica (strain DSM 17448 / CIP 109782 / MTCC 6937 / GPTSA100-15) TaxID=929562 RepID=A0ABN4ADT0_EMTOG|nr:Rrf2 family transcriptional regulator [Emticicia oligotrophica]AFK01610.1 transcriptional regulator, BadM/Rrf2 family [Emticicia oligotrophica DSM 17448]
MITKKAKYALKALSVLARSYMVKPVLTLTEIASEDNLPKKFLETILHDLRRAGILSSTQGKNGGYFLNNPPNEIVIARLIRLIDGPIAPTLCVSLHFYGKCDDCGSEESCKIRPLMMKVRDANLSVYENMTLADIL